MPRLARLSLAAMVALVAAACGGSDEPAAPAPKPSVFQEILDQGAGKYVGKARITATADDGGVTRYTFDPASGPVCMTGEPYGVMVREGASDDLFLFLQGGGACWSTFCLAITQATETLPAKLDVLDPGKPTNPLAAHDLVYFPYCDGSMFAGDAAHDDDGDGTIDRDQRGLANLSAGLDVARRRFPHPRRIVLAGSSGGGYGTILAAILVRAAYPDQELLVVNDAGPGLGRPGDEGFLSGVLSELGIDPLLPKSCPDCVARGHVTGLLRYGLEHDPKLRVAMFSSYEDYVISDVFLQVPAADYHAALVDETGRLTAAYPDRLKRFFVAGAVHTTLLGGVDGLIGDDLKAVKLPPGAATKLGNIKIGAMDTSVVRGVTFATWLAAALDGSPAWDDRLE